ncbi:hypothetical protein MIR68_000956 [Amoeboaphelidium protococcarum]|nr:hypothetical protein MIR68_000956 [Amoeboaphelidium protococcarum]
MRESAFHSAGLAWDRQWMVVNADGEFMTQRKYPKMSLISPSFILVNDQVEGLNLACQSASKVEISVKLVTSNWVMKCKVWDDTVDCFDQGDQVSAWLSEILGVECRLVFKDQNFRRTLDQTYVAEDGYSYDTQAALADGFPLLIITKESIERVNEELQQRGKLKRVSSTNFRPNIVIGGAATAFAEDEWKTLSVSGGLTLDCVKPCTRCALPNVDPETGIPSEEGEPLKTLMAFRRVDSRFKYHAIFGVNAVHRSTDFKIRIGDTITASL